MASDSTHRQLLLPCFTEDVEFQVELLAAELTRNLRQTVRRRIQRELETGRVADAIDELHDRIDHLEVEISQLCEALQKRAESDPADWWKKGYEDGQVFGKDDPEDRF